MHRNHQPRRTTGDTHITSTIAMLLAVTLLFVGCGTNSADGEAVVGDLVAGAGVAPDELIDLLRVNDASSFATAIQDVDLSEVTTATEFTIFAPNDEAFLALTADETAELLASPENLVTLLRQHVVPELLDSADLASRSSVTTAAGTTLEITNADGSLLVGGATVVQPDAHARPGMAIHVINKVVLP